MALTPIGAHADGPATCTIGTDSTGETRVLADPATDLTELRLGTDGDNLIIEWDVVDLDAPMPDHADTFNELGFYGIRAWELTTDDGSGTGPHPIVFQGSDGSFSASEYDSRLTDSVDIEVSTSGNTVRAAVPLAPYGLSTGDALTQIRPWTWVSPGYVAVMWDGDSWDWKAEDYPSNSSYSYTIGSC